MEVAGFCQSRGWSQAAAENYVAALKQDPSNPQLHVGDGQNFATLGRTAEASGHAAEAVRLAPDFAEAYSLLGVLLGRQGRLQEAAEQFREVLRLQPESVEARVNLGTALAKAGRVQEALELVVEALQREPTNARALTLRRSLERSAPKSP